MELDNLLDRPDGVADDAWFSILCSVLTQTTPPARA